MAAGDMMDARTVAGANAVIALRCCKLSGRFENFRERRATAGKRTITKLTCSRKPDRKG